MCSPLSIAGFFLGSGKVTLVPCLVCWFADLQQKPYKRPKNAFFTLFFKKIDKKIFGYVHMVSLTLEPPKKEKIAVRSLDPVF